MNGVMESTELKGTLAVLKLRLEIHSRNCQRCSEHLGFCWTLQRIEDAIHRAEDRIQGME